MKMEIAEQSLLMDGKKYTRDTLHVLKQAAEEDLSSPLSQLYSFLKDWFAESPYMVVRTSGSTGVPKELHVRKEQMMQSARLTCEVLGLRRGDRALLCMNLRYMGAMMVVVRALVAGLDLVVKSPSGHPLADVDGPLRFAAMVPLQVYNTLGMPEEKRRLSQVDILIIGGGAIDDALEKELQALPGAVYSTYGMTETLSHIALRRLNGPSASPCYRPFPSVGLSLSPEDTLVIEAPLVCDEVLHTNDVAFIHPDGSFRILGRKDNIINSGGIKIQAEELERLFHPYIPAPFAVTSVSDRRLGEALTLLVEPVENLPAVEEKLLSVAPTYQAPRHIRVVNEIPRTENGKINRAACKGLAEDLIGGK